MGYPYPLSERIFLLGNPYLPCYLVTGDRFSVLIEPGVSSTARHLIEQIETLNIDPAGIGRLIITHAHADHLTGAAVLKKAIAGIIVSGSADAKRLLEREKVRNIFVQDDADIGLRLKKKGAGDEPEDVGGGLKDLISETLLPGQRIDLGGVALEVIDAPGHCVGGQAFWEPEEKVLFCSDYLGFFLPSGSVVPNFYVNLADYLATFDSLVELGPQWICPGHFGVYAGEEAIGIVDRSRTEIEWIKRRVLSRGVSSDSGGEAAALQQELFDRYYVHEATMFSEKSTRYCMQLLVRRILEAEGGPGLSLRIEPSKRP
jgi:glyoxylase-like metal-dependent hydrolase (beta-lactamase superfamily II)